MLLLRSRLVLCMFKTTTCIASSTTENTREMTDQKATPTMSLTERMELMVAIEVMPLKERREAMNKFYDDWVLSGYDEDVVTSEFGLVAHIHLAKEIGVRVADKSVRLLDCASGSGFLGKELKGIGFTNLDALDASQGSLDFSRKKNVYKNFICATLCADRLPIEDDSYDVVCLASSFGRGHVQPDCIPEWIRITKPGGLIMFVSREENLVSVEGFCNGAVDAIFHKLSSERRVEYLEKKRVLYKHKVNESGDQTIYAYMFVVKVL